MAKCVTIGGVLAIGLAISACHPLDAGMKQKPFIAVGSTAAPANDQAPLPGMVQKKPFIAFSHPLHPQGSPTTLLAEHARSDSPVPLSEYPKQKMFALASFDLRQNISAEQVQRKMGPPAALADYSDPWTVYRLTRGRELWLHFSTDASMLRSADVIQPTEDGYSRTRVFDSGLDQ